MKLKLFLLLWLASSFGVCTGDEVDRLPSLLRQLDLEVAQANGHRSAKERLIREWQDRRKASGLTADERYEINRQLTHAYEYYRCDSAHSYALAQLDAAERAGREEWIIDSKIQLASVLFKAAMFDASLSLLEGLAQESLAEAQKIAYHKAYYEAHVCWLEFYDDGYSDTAMMAARDRHYERFLSVLPKSTYEYASYFGIKHINEGHLDQAERVLFVYLPNAKLGTRPYSILNSVLAFFYRTKLDREKEMAHLALSAISDIRGNIMENASLRELATLLYDAGDLDRANRYILKSMEDANFYNARIRNFQTSRVLQIINKAYEVKQSAQQQALRRQLVVISLLSVVLLIGIFFIVREVRKVSAAKRKISVINEQLTEKNRALAETNHIKEEYIGHFLTLCSLYIEKLGKYQKKLFNKAKTSNAEDLFKTIKSTRFIEEEREEFYQKFDESFLKLFPDFVSRFNSLLPEHERIMLKPGERLTTEMRIFALVRLGISDSNKIAEFLNYSLATIYNYRSRYRNKALVPRDEFENEILKIGATQP